MAKDSVYGVFAFIFWSIASIIGIVFNAGLWVVYLSWVCAIYAFYIAKTYAKIEKAGPP
jgi:positive regulator of sigma E activity